MTIQAQLYSENLGFPWCASQDWIMDSVCGGVGGFNHFVFNAQKQQSQQQHMQQVHNQQLRNQNLSFEDSSLASTLKSNPDGTYKNSSHLSYSQSVAAQFEKHRQEIDQYIRLQNERLRVVLQQQRKQQLAGLLKKIESKTLTLLRQKDEEIARAANRTMELEDFLRRLEAENEAWQRVAQENEAMVVSLNNTIEQLKESAPCGFNNGAEDAESCCDVNIEREEQEEAEENRGWYEVEQREGMVCKSCNHRSSCVLFLPCRHLCSCKACESLLDYCPICRSEKKASIEALIF